MLHPASQAPARVHSRRTTPCIGHRVLRAPWPPGPKHLALPCRSAGRQADGSAAPGPSQPFQAGPGAGLGSQQAGPPTAARLSSLLTGLQQQGEQVKLQLLHRCQVQWLPLIPVHDGNVADGPCGSLQQLTCMRPVFSLLWWSLLAGGLIPRSTVFVISLPEMHR